MTQPQTCVASGPGYAPSPARYPGRPLTPNDSHPRCNGAVTHREPPPGRPPGLPLWSAVGRQQSTVGGQTHLLTPGFPTMTAFQPEGPLPGSGFHLLPYNGGCPCFSCFPSTLPHLRSGCPTRTIKVAPNLGCPCKNFTVILAAWSCIIFCVSEM